MPTSASDLQRSYRETIGQFATGVTIVHEASRPIQRHVVSPSNSRGQKPANRLV